MDRKIIACEVMKEELLAITPEGEVDYEFLPMGLHDVPGKLRAELQRIIDRSTGYGTIILGYGLCGQATGGLQATTCPLIIPRIHECIPLLMGSLQAYQEIKEAFQGTIFLTGGWTEGERAILAEYRRMCDKFGREEADELLKILYGSYKFLFFINTCHPRNEGAKGYAQEVARLLRLNYRETHGNLNYLARLVNGPWTRDEFVLVEKGSFIRDQEFY